MKKIITTFIFLAGFSFTSSACPFCNKKVMDGIYNSQFYPNLLSMFAAFVVLALIVVLLTVMFTKKHKTIVAAAPKMQLLSPVPLTTASMVLGIGLGGFIDGIVFHQVFQLHEMLSNKIPATDYVGKSVNMFWDGIFHFFCLLVVFTGIVLMWKLLHRKDADHSGKLLGGGLLSGWGLFNIVEAVINHQVLKLHNVIEFLPNHDIVNFSFLGISVLLLIAGNVIIYSSNKNRYQVVATKVTSAIKI